MNPGGPSRRPDDGPDGRLAPTPEPSAVTADEGIGQGHEGEDEHEQDDEEGWDDETLAINPSSIGGAGASSATGAALRASKVPVIDVPAARPSPGRPSPSPTSGSGGGSSAAGSGAAHARNAPTHREGRPVGSLSSGASRAEATPIPGKAGESVRPAPPYRGPLGSSPGGASLTPRPGASSTSFVPMPLQNAGGATPAPPAAAAAHPVGSSAAAPEGHLSDASMQKLLDDVRFATERLVPRLIEKQLAEVLEGQRAIQNRLDRLEAMVRLAQSTADEAASLVPVQPARSATVHTAAAVPAPAPIVVQGVAAPLPVAPPIALAATPVIAPMIQPGPIADTAALTVAAAPRVTATPVSLPSPSPSLDVEIPSELVGKKGKGVWFFLILALLVLAGFGAVVVSSNMS